MCYKATICFSNKPALFSVHVVSFYVTDDLAMKPTITIYSSAFLLLYLIFITNLSMFFCMHLNRLLVVDIFILTFIWVCSFHCMKYYWSLWLFVTYFTIFWLFSCFCDLYIFMCYYTYNIYLVIIYDLVKVSDTISSPYQGLTYWVDDSTTI